MPKKTKASEPIRPALIAPLTEILRDKGNDVRLWPKDGASAYRNAKGFQAGRDAVQQIRMAKAAAALEDVIGMARPTPTPTGSSRRST